MNDQPRHRSNLLADKALLVSGGTQGVGAAIVRAAVDAGASVVFSGRNTEKGKSLAAEFNGAPVRFVHADLADPRAATGSVADTIAEFGRIDALVNAAGTTTRGSLLDTTPELFDSHVAVNLRAPFFTMQAAVADMVGRNAPGSIVNIITMSSHGGQSFLAPYSATKAGLVGLTKNAAHAHRWDRIRINGLNIGWTETEGEADIQKRFHGADDSWIDDANASVPMGKLGQPDEIADFVVFLLSERSGVVTGSVIDWDQIVMGGID
ncbi:SDR family oxidoreductase [Gordonia sp. Z-3]|jgi:NAD(P)-dependent dehydrogenase (short-subunit alcohol dehydrogenase family)|uniref:SDR family oxidoreductase n=1 Tax=Gordonia sp. Z-3 TaxID=3115408 RepID=UPI002E2BD230|nr:SDR family oxidoreductase [Gordonia sp. Z-3]MED5799622.1 SDR family oxidoreductase [Gordonia sp. Z-3]